MTAYVEPLDTYADMEPPDPARVLAAPRRGSSTSPTSAA